MKHLIEDGPLDTPDSLSEVSRLIADRPGSVRLTGLRGAARAVVAAHVLIDHGPKPALVLVPNAKSGDAIAADLQAALGEPAEGGRIEYRHRLRSDRDGCSGRRRGRGSPLTLSCRV